jgi:predicted aldo/keto reductase-like oxidoreductase
MSPAECYRFCLTSPHVDVVLQGPANRAQLDENLKALEAGPLAPPDEARIRKFGAAVHGS